MERLEKFNEYFAEYQQQIFYKTYGIVKNKEAAEDILQEVFMQLFIRLSYNNQLQRVDQWLYVTAQNMAISHLRKQKYRIHKQIEENDASCEPFTDALNKLYISELLDGLRQQNQKWYDIVEMHFINEMSIEEIAGVLKCSKKSVENGLYRAKQYLNKEYGNANADLLIILLVSYVIKKYVI